MQFLITILEDYGLSVFIIFTLIFLLSRCKITIKYPKRWETGKTIRPLKTVDEDIIGGMIIIIEDEIIDGSIRHKLEQMSRSLSEVKVH